MKCDIKWGSLPDWPQYEISSDGSVRSLIGPGFAHSKGRRTPRYKRPQIGKDGYYNVILWDKPNKRNERWDFPTITAVGCALSQGKSK
jgi:hypothetical protein